MNHLVKNNSIDEIDREVKELIASYDELIPKLIQSKKPLTAIATLNFLDYSIYEKYRELTSIYSLLLNGLELLESFKSTALDTLKSKGVTGGFFKHGLHKTYGMYLEEECALPENVTIDTLLKKSRKILVSQLRKSDFVAYSRLKEIFFYEIQYLIYVLRDIVEDDWRRENDENDADNEKPNRYITKEVKLTVWRRDQGKCCECGAKEKIEFDHIIPASKGGSNTERNIQLLCESCNRRKSANIV